MLNKIIAFSIKNKLIIGLFVIGLIGYGSYQFTKLPIDAVPDIPIKYVFEKTGKNKFEMIGIEMRTTENGFTKIVSKADLSGKEIVTKGAYALLMSLKNKEEE